MGQVEARVRQRFRERVAYVLGVLRLVRMWAAREDAVHILVVMGRISQVQREQLHWLGQHLRRVAGEPRNQGQDIPVTQQ